MKKFEVSGLNLMEPSEEQSPSHAVHHQATAAANSGGSSSHHSLGGGRRRSSVLSKDFLDLDFVHSRDFNLKQQDHHNHGRRWTADLPHFEPLMIREDQEEHQDTLFLKKPSHSPSGLGKVHHYHSDDNDVDLFSHHHNSSLRERCPSHSHSDSESDVMHTLHAPNVEPSLFDFHDHHHNLEEEILRPHTSSELPRMRSHQHSYLNPYNLADEMDAALNLNLNLGAPEYIPLHSQSHHVHQQRFQHHLNAPTQQSFYGQQEHNLIHSQFDHNQIQQQRFNPNPNMHHNNNNLRRNAATNSTANVQGPVGANLFVFNFPRHFTDQDLTREFAPFGNILSATVFIDKNTGRSKCFGFVSYDDVECARLAIETLNGCQMGGKVIKVQLKKQN